MSFRTNLGVGGGLTGKSLPAPPDSTCMRVWTSTTFRALDLLAAPTAPEEPDTREVAAILAAAVEAKLPVILTRADPGTRPLPIEATLNAGDHRSVSIGRPVYKPGQRSLAPGERLQIRFQLDGGTYIGSTSVLMKFEPEAGAGPATVGYQLAAPETLVFDDRRRSERVAVAFRRPLDVELLNAPTHRPIAMGSLVDLAIGGARIRSAGAGSLRAGDRVLVRAKLDEDTRIHSLAVVVHAGKTRDGTAEVGVRFTTEIPNLDRYLREIITAGGQRGGSGS